MTIRHLVDAIFPLGIGLSCLWLGWRTGMPGGKQHMDPRRDERPVQFWIVVLLYVAMGIVFAAEGVSKLRG